MNKLLITTMFMVFGLTVSAQNVVSNFDFSTKEPGTGCPAVTGFGNGRPAGWFDGFFNAHSPDYFHPCAPSDGTGLYPGPNRDGCEFPLSGTAYVGALAFMKSDPDSGSEYFRQSVSLTADQQYYIEFWVSSADDEESNAYVKHLGMLITRQLDDLDDPGHNGSPVHGLHHWRPQIPNTFPAANFYTTENGWQKISGTFTPSSTGAHHIIIGNFDPGINQNPTNPTHLLKPGEPDLGDDIVSYYFFDAVTIQPSNQPIPVRTPFVTGPSLMGCSII